MLPLKTVEAYPAPAPAGDLALVADHLTKRFGDRTAVNGLSLNVPKGEVFGFLVATGRARRPRSACLAPSLPPAQAQL